MKSESRVRSAFPSFSPLFAKQLPKFVKDPLPLERRRAIIRDVSFESGTMAIAGASKFEFLNLRLLRLLIFGLAVGAYLFDRDDIVWATAPWRTPHDRIVAHVVFLCAAVLVGLAAALRTWSRAYSNLTLGFEYVRKDRDWVANGPFRFVRHPIVLGELLFVLGMGFLLSLTGVVITLVGIGALTAYMVSVGEREFRQKSGPEYNNLCRAVSRLWPSFRPLGPLGGRKGQWGNAFRMEAADWGYFIMLAAFSITLQDRLAWTLAAAAFFISLVLNPPFRRTTAVGRSFQR